MSALATSGRPFGPEDDSFHELGDRWWATETAWFSFHHAQRRLGGWLYTLARPNIGTVQGGAWVWDADAWAPWEIRYCANHSSKRLEPGTDLRHATLATGVTIQVLEPLRSYRIGYSEPGRFEAELRFDAIMDPFPFASGEPPFLSASHFDQTGRVTGRVVLDGEPIDIDCFSVRDRSWGPRPEHRPQRLSYCFGTTSPESAFFATSRPRPDHDLISHGYLIRDGRLARIVGGERRVERDPVTGWVTRETIAGRDESGREFHAAGTPVSRVAVNRHLAVTWTYLTRWDLDGEQAWGEDQDMWPVEQWSRFRREARGAWLGQDVRPASSGAAAR